MTKNYFYASKVHPDGSITLQFRHDIPYKTRLRIAKKIEKKGGRKVTLYNDGRLEIWATGKPYRYFYALRSPEGQVIKRLKS